MKLLFDFVHSKVPNSKFYEHIFIFKFIKHTFRMLTLKNCFMYMYIDENNYFEYNVNKQVLYLVLRQCCCSQETWQSRDVDKLVLKQGIRSEKNSWSFLEGCSTVCRLDYFDLLLIWSMKCHPNRGLLHLVKLEIVCQLLLKIKTYPGVFSATLCDFHPF